MRRFEAEYLRYTRDGLWTDRDALAALSLSDRRRIADVGAGTGELTRVLAAEAPQATVVGVDADRRLLEVARSETRAEVVAGDAERLPIETCGVDLAVCQALLVNLAEPATAVGELARVSSDLVAAIEPDNAAVEVSSTVDGEETVDRRAREAFRDAADTDVALGSRVRELFRAAGLVDVRTRRHEHEKRIEPPYSERGLEATARKASGSAIAAAEAELTAALGPEGYDRLRTAWREVGRRAVEQMETGEYRRVEVVPFDVTVGRV